MAGAREVFDVKFAHFFDRKGVADVIDAKNRRRLARAGAFIMKAARRMVRKRKRSSRPGESPSSHTHVLRDRIFFAADVQNTGVVIGPEKSNQVYFDGDGQPVRGTVPQVLEFGGEITILEVENAFAESGWSRADLRSRRRLAGRQRRMRTVAIDERPYMGPALERLVASPRFMTIWHDSIG